MIPLGLQIQDRYPWASIDVEVSSGDNDVPTLDALATTQKKQLAMTLTLGSLFS
jgi:hypothetical protein